MSYACQRVILRATHSFFMTKLIEPSTDVDFRVVFLLCLYLSVFSLSSTTYYRSDKALGSVSNFGLQMSSIDVKC